MLLSPAITFAQDTTVLVQQARRFANASFRNDQPTIIKMTYPPLVEMAGGDLMMQKSINDKLEQLHKQGITKVDGSIGPAGSFHNAGEEIHSLLPEDITLRVKGGVYKSRSYLLAISKNGGKNWWFMDVGNMPQNILYRLVPALSPEIKIPAATPPVFVADQP
ncbi:hypothetical protein FPZ43_16215 [Mucilaginibacter pallidiroseus]|uniref:Uncharacterized protein n=1 Tax=Mucilaginibacter pallidiroseus TaxID=2599295 RepID=A0A563U3A1_9SPHI|nr:hypothetical protein [Mucilaginibacter pallidiroseus]TWR25826.1 hypothetical protein FPZ43_16215 [Mucilaginibacter pallidiroseus]